MEDFEKYVKFAYLYGYRKIKLVRDLYCLISLALLIMLIFSITAGGGFSFLLSNFTKGSELSFLFIVNTQSIKHFIAVFFCIMILSVANVIFFVNHKYRSPLEGSDDV